MRSVLQFLLTIQTDFGLSARGAANPGGSRHNKTEKADAHVLLPLATRSNQANALFSTGPLTDAGNAITGRAALSHGLTSTKVLLPGDSQEEYNAFAADHIRVYTPGDLTDAHWSTRSCQ